MKALLIDDEQPALEEMQHLLNSYKDIEIVGFFKDAKAALAAIPELHPDVVFLDIDMPGMNGLEMAVQIQSFQAGIMIIFVTAHSHYALEAFQSYPLDYILKPVDEIRFGKTMDQLFKQYQLKLLYNEQPPKIQIRCFGKLELLRNDAGREIMKWKTRRAKELFAYLLNRFDKPVSRQELLQVFFDGIEDKKTINYLHVTVYKVRSLLSNFGIDHNMINIRENYTLEIADGICDYVDFVRFINANPMVNENNVERAEEIMSLYQGDYLQEEDYLWALETRDWLKIQYENWLSNLAVFYLARGASDQAERILKQLLRANPLSETGNHELLEMYMEPTRHPQFRSQYENYSRILQEELGLYPEEKYRTYYESLMQGGR